MPHIKDMGETTFVFTINYSLIWHLHSVIYRFKFLFVNINMTNIKLSRNTREVIDCVYNQAVSKNFLSAWAFFRTARLINYQNDRNGRVAICDCKTSIEDDLDEDDLRDPMLVYRACTSLLLTVPNVVSFA